MVVVAGVGVGVGLVGFGAAHLFILAAAISQA